MSQLSLSQLSRKMAKLDYAMMTTRTPDGGQSSRPMSNNGDVEYGGDSYFFASGTSRKVSQLQADSRVGLTFTGAVGMLGGSPLFFAIDGQAKLVRDRGMFAAHWTSDLDKYFPDGVETPDLVMIHVRAEHIRYWDGADEGELAV